MSFPAIPVGIQSALLLYGCAYDGENDGRYVRDAGLLDVTVVDCDRSAVDRMRALYPPEWTFKCQFAEDVLIQPGRFDLVVADPYGGDDMDEVHGKVMILNLHRMQAKMLVVGGYTDKPAPMEGARQVWRNPNYCWWVWRS